jgi:hypothetical protein
MGWEQRSGRLYYYRKRREGRRVISEYVGAGPLAEAIAALDSMQRLKHRALQQAWQCECEAEAKVVAEVDAFGVVVRAATHAALLLAGYHTHKGQWRRKRE